MRKGLQIKDRAIKGYWLFETSIVLVLLVLVMIMVLFSTGTLALEIITRVGQRLAGQPPLDPQITSHFIERFSTLREVYGAFMLVLIGIELMKTIIMYLDKHVLHVEVVFTVAMIAIARHAIDIDLKAIEPLALIGTGILILSLAVGYFYFRRAVGGAAGADRSHQELHGDAPPASR